MTKMSLKNDNINKFYRVIDSLTLTGRANLEERFNTKTVDVYVDLLDPVHEDWLNPSPKSLIYYLKGKRTIFILGRKGTGKSTLFQVLKDINNKEIEKSLQKDGIINEILIYINARESFDLSTLVSSEEIGSEFRFLSFLDVFMKTIVKNIKKFFSSTKTRWYKKFFRNYSRAYELFTKEIDNIQNNLIFEIEKSKSQDKNIRQRQTKKEKSGKKISISSKPSVSLDKEKSAEVEIELEKKTHDTIIRIINPSEIFQKIKDSLISNFKIKSVILLLDDFSDLSQEIMNELIEKVISPQVTASDPFYFFKIAAYPSRLTTGDIPEDKVESIGIDIGDIFAWGRKADKELPFNRKIQRGIEYTKILIQRRCQKIAKNKEIFKLLLKPQNKESIDDIYKTLFFASFTNPRILGYILSYSLKHALLGGAKSKIELGHINQASKDYFQRMIDKNYFQKKGKIKQAYDEKLNLATQEIIFNNILDIAKQNQENLIKAVDKGKSKLLKEIYDVYNTIFNSHFRLQKGNVSDLLKSLELNQYITHFSEGRSRDKSKQTNLYFFNYGLCLEKGLDFGIPTDKSITRPDKFISQDRNFNYTEKLIEKLKGLMHIKCETRDCKFKPIPIEQEIIADHFGWKCPICNGVLVRKALPEISETLIENYNETEEKIKTKFEFVLSSIQYEIIQALSFFEIAVHAKDLSNEINLSSKSIGLRMKKLSENGFVDIINSSPKKYIITEKGNDYLGNV